MRMLLPRPRYYPIDMQKNKVAEILNVALHLILIAIEICLLALVLVATKDIGNALRTFLIVAAAGSLVGLYSVTAGKPAYLNFSRNAGLALMTLIASKGSQKAAFVLCDMASVSVLGLQILLEENPSMVNKQVILFDSMGEDETLILATAEKSAYAASKLKDKIKDERSVVVTPQRESYSALSLFKNAILMS